MSYRCCDCEAEFSELKIYTERHGLDTLPFEELDCCPVCGSRDYEELYTCKICSNSLPLQEMSDEDEYVCKDCASDIKDSWNRIRRHTLRNYFKEGEIAFINDCDL